MNNISFSYENPLRSLFGEEFFKAIPTDPGVYFFLDSKRKPLYIGKADSLRRRLCSYQAAKPGQAQEHILEMIELAREIRWEIHDSGEKALLRESTLIRSLQPPFNIVGTGPTTYLFCGISAEKRTGERVPVHFRLSHNEDLGPKFSTFGCFNHRGKTKAGYSALLRLFFAATCERERFHLPARLCRTSPAYVHKGEVPAEWLEPLQKFLSGESAELLRLITTRLLARESLPPYLYAPLQRDLNAAKLFFEAGPLSTRKLSAALPAKKKALKKHPFISQDHMLELLTKSVSTGLLKNTRTVRRSRADDRKAPKMAQSVSS